MRATILFDLDGTLIDSTEAILDGFAYAFARFGLQSPPKEAILRLVGHPLDFMFAHLGVDGEVRPFVEAYKERYRRISKEKTTLLPRAKEAIVEASRWARLGVVTTKTGIYSRELLEHMGLMGYFEILVGREDVHHPKPHPEPILKAMHALGGKREHTYMVGDTCLDAVSAKRAGILEVGVRCGYGELQELERCFSQLCEDAFDAVNFIKRRECVGG